MFDDTEKDALEKRREDNELLRALASVHYHFGNDRTAILLLKLSAFILPGDPRALRLLAMAEYRIKRPHQALEAILDYEAANDSELDEELSQIKGLSLAMIGEIDAARATLAR